MKMRKENLEVEEGRRVRRLKIETSCVMYTYLQLPTKNVDFMYFKHIQTHKEINKNKG